MIDASGRAYDLASERGTILRVAPDKSHEIFSPGSILVWHSIGTATCSVPSKGATWLANGSRSTAVTHPAWPALWIPAATPQHLQV
jgi:hypothetical protein